MSPGTMTRAFGSNRSFSSRSCCSRSSASNSSLLLTVAYMPLLSRAFANRTPLCSLPRLRPVSIDLGICTPGTLEVLGILIGLWTSFSIRRLASCMDSVPVQASAVASSRVWREADVGRSASDDLRFAAAMRCSSCALRSALKPASSTALMALCPPLSRASSLISRILRVKAPSSFSESCLIGPS